MYTSLKIICDDSVALKEDVHYIMPILTINLKCGNNNNCFFGLISDIGIDILL
jgi:hypothetical protein